MNIKPGTKLMAKDVGRYCNRHNQLTPGKIYVLNHFAGPARNFLTDKPDFYIYVKGQLLGHFLSSFEILKEPLKSHLPEFL